MKKQSYTKENWKKLLIFGNIFLGLIVFSLLINSHFALAEGQVNVCCEKTVNGAWCQNDLRENCDPEFKISPTSCDSTSYCKPGCCFDSHEGLCIESTPQRVCEAQAGTYANDSQCNVPQCNLGCCVLQDQGAFVTLTRCKSLSGIYGVQTDFRRNIEDEVSCIAVAQGQDKGACVEFNPELLRNECRFTTRANCQGALVSSIEDTNSTKNVTKEVSTSPGQKFFFKNILCTAEELGTVCAPTKKTTILEGKDEVFYLDSCGNVANIYDSTKYNDKEYWKKVFRKEESCGAGKSNARSKTCGNCDYYLGSIGRAATGILGKPTFGDYICISLNCNNGKRHGESWCVYDTPSGGGLDPVGSRYFKEVCIFGEVLTEPCADFRNEMCIEGNFGSFTEAACRTNRWQTCVSQTTKRNCENYDQRDCFWTRGYYFSNTTNQIEKSTNDSNGDGTYNDPTVQGLCLPEYPPGLVFWSSTSSSSSSTGNSSLGTGVVSTSTTASSSAATSQCSLGNAAVTLQWIKESHNYAWWKSHEEQFGEWECNNTVCHVYVAPANEHLGNITIAEVRAWANKMSIFCYNLGDCGGYINWIGERTTDGFAAFHGNTRVAGLGGAETLAGTIAAGNSS